MSWKPVIEAMSFVERMDLHQRNHTQIKRHNVTYFETKRARGGRQIRVLRLYQKNCTVSKALGFHAHHCFAAEE
jgi:hypothetical protein